MSKQILLRSDTTVGSMQALKVDRDNLIIRDVVAMQAGIQATGHGFETDLKTLQIMEHLGNHRQPKAGDTSGWVRESVKQRLGHPGMSESAEGKQVAIAKNFRIVGDKLVHDSHLLESARKSPVFSQDVVEWLMFKAEHEPAEIGESVVVFADTVWLLPDGSEMMAEDEDGMATKRPAEALNEFPILRPVLFTHVDYVNEGALTHSGLFDTREELFTYHRFSSAFSEQLFTLIDQFRAKFGLSLEELEDKGNEVFLRYLKARGAKDMAVESIKRKSKKTLEGGLEFAPPVEEETIAAPIAEEEVEDDPLAEAEAEQDALAASLEEEPEPEEDDESAEDLRAEVVSLRARSQRQEAIIAKMSKSLSIMHERLSALESEPIVSGSVSPTRLSTGRQPRHRAASLTPPPSIAAPRSNAKAAVNGGNYASQAGAVSDDPRVKALETQARRRRNMEVK